MHQELKEQLQPKGVVASALALHGAGLTPQANSSALQGSGKTKEAHSYRLQNPLLKDTASNETFAVTPFPSQTCLPTRPKEESLNYTRKVRSLQKMRGYKNVTNCSFY